ncbi:MAG TPA: oxygenase MpaB family protein [Stellaceae bacterium]|nr:oxygenase MpaB family protein [Stellaceae bacterium]
MAATAPRIVEAEPRLFDPASLTWRINRERILILGGVRSLLMQIAHPLVAAGVAEHSGFRADPLGRLRRTMETMAVILFGTAAEARGAAAQLDAIHGRVHGILREQAGGFPAGTRYTARDPELLLWVHATLVDSTMLVYRRFVRELGAAEAEAYYQESKTIARLYGIPERLIPRRLCDFRGYVERMLEAGPIAVSATARELAAHIVRPAIPMLPALGTAVVSLVSIGLMPPRLRDEFGLTWGPLRQAIVDAAAFGTRTLLPAVPAAWRVAPAAYAFEQGAGMPAPAGAGGYRRRKRSTVAIGKRGTPSRADSA